MDASEIDQELEALGSKAEQLRALYEQYFMGLERIEPLIMRKDVERRVRILRREQLRNTAQRFRFNTLVQRINTLGTHWARVVREIENGTYRRDVLRAAARFGDGALTALGKKNTRGLAAAVAQAQQQKRPVEDAFELEADDLIEDEEDDTDAPTPPRLERVAAVPSSPVAVVVSSAPAPARPPIAAGAPLSAAPGAVAKPGGQPAAAPRLPAMDPLAAAASNPPAAAGGDPQAPGPKRIAGLRWGGSAPLADAATPVGRPAAEVSRRVADLATQLGAPRSEVAKPSASFGELDLDFDDAPAARPTVAASPPRPASPARLVPAAPSLPVPTPLPAAARAAAAAPQSPSAPSRTAGFGELDLPLEGLTSPAAGDAQTPGGRSPATRPGIVARPQAARPPVTNAPPVAPSAAELPDQRIRQIYAKYVDTKRSTQESTAGVTFEKLAATLRAQADKLRSAHPNKSVDYEVVVKDGKTHLKPVLR